MPMPPRPVWPHTLLGALVLLAPLNLLASLGLDLYLPALPIMPAALGASPEVIQLTLSLYLLVLGSGQLVFGPLSDRVGRRPVLILGGALFALASAGLAASPSAPMFLSLRLVQAVGASASLVAIFGAIRDVYAGKPEGATVYAAMNGMLAAIPALGPILGALILQAFGWRGLFVALAVGGGGAVVHALFCWAETRERVPHPAGGGLRRILASGPFWVYTLGFSAAMGSFFVFFSTGPRVLIGAAGYSEMQFSLAFATTAGVMIATTFAAKPLVARWGVEGSVTRGMLLIGAGAGLLIPGELWLPPSFLAFVVPMWVIAIGIILASSVTAEGALGAFGDVAGTAVALYFTVECVIVSLVGTGLIVLLDGGTSWPLAAFAGLMSLATLAGLRLARRPLTPDAGAPPPPR